MWSKTDGESDKKINIDNLKMFRLLGGMPRVTFQVDMTDITVNPNGVHIAGSFNSWDPSGNELSNINNDNFQIYEIKLDLSKGDYEFKFINGNSWGGSGVRIRGNF